MRFPSSAAALSLLFLNLSPAQSVELTGYEYIVVGSGAGGGPLAARLALAGHKTLLIEAGDDQGSNYNYSVPAYSARSSEDATMAWDFFVRHYADDERQARDYKTTYQTPDGGVYTGLNPPADSTIKGTLYPRAVALGGCTAHNALVTIYPYDSDFDYIAQLTGDEGWKADAMRKHWIKAEDNTHLLPITPGHGYKGWLGVDTASLTLPLTDGQLLSNFLGGAFALGNLTDQILNIATLLAGDANSVASTRDKISSYYQVPITSKDDRRNGAREFILSVRDAKNADGSKRYPLDVRLNCHVTKVTIDNTLNSPRATGVEFLDGKFLYRASPRSQSAGKGTPGSAKASREVIVAGGTYNSPQILKLSGIGPADELEKHGIPVVVDLPGVGTNLQDHYEVAVQAQMPKDFATLDGCTFTGNKDTDPCLRRWDNPILGDRGTYQSPGLGVAMYYSSTTAETGAVDVNILGGPVNFRGYFPGYSINVTERHDIFTWAVLKGHPRNNAGSVTLRSADPLDVPDIHYNYFDTGSGDASADLTAMAEAIEIARDAFDRQLIDTKEVLPGDSVKTRAQIETYVKDTAWGHHASSTCPIGTDDDPLAVLDSKFRVRGVQGLRVVDASVYPKIPGTFTAVSTYMVGEKAASDILAELVD
ncbi:Oxygen-dependent choline dehydrogenase [Paramyrothecium foliicola]|nr:Oxygen-dependent choline dehydrogenase [Paramyrothecium foliicola]